MKSLYDSVELCTDKAQPLLQLPSHSGQWQCHVGSLLAMEYGKRWHFVKVPGSRIENDRGKPLSLGIRNLEAPASAFWCLVGWWFTRLGRVASSAGLRGPDSRKAGFHWAAAGLIESGRAHSVHISSEPYNVLISAKNLVVCTQLYRIIQGFHKR